MDYSDRFKENLDATLAKLPHLSFLIFFITVEFKVHFPEYPWMTCFLATLGIGVLQILFGVTVYSIPKKDSLFIAIVTYILVVFVIPALCIDYMRV